MAYSTATITASIKRLKDEFRNIKLLAGGDRIGPPDSGIIAESMLLSQESGKLIAESIEIPEMAVDIERAVAQVEKSLKVEKLKELGKN